MLLLTVFISRKTLEVLQYYQLIGDEKVKHSKKIDNIAFASWSSDYFIK
jgi:hypothetical protein